MTQPDPEAWIDPIFDAVVSDVQASGYFDRVNLHEAKRAPGYGLTAAVWLQELDVVPSRSGLSVTTAVLVFMVRSYMGMLSEPQDMIDPYMTRAVGALARRYHDDFDFAGAISNVDLLGMSGYRLRARAGYVDISGTIYRIFDLTVPCIVNDVWTQVK